MPITLYNTLTRKKELLTPLAPSSVGLYTCGPTVYSSAHIGNLRTYIFEDLLTRVLRFNGLAVKHVMNITDVGHLSGHNDHQDEGVDKIEAAAKREHKDAYQIAEHYTQIFFGDLARLNIVSPTVVLKATETIALQIDLIKKLETSGFTYQTSDGIYFDTSKDATYGRLSGQKTSEKRAGARVEVNDEKKNPSDFALWKFSRPDEQRQMEWPSPWGVGFPGWHIECSAMSISEFPNGLDIHCGGIDHIPVHHENEIAQNEGAGYHDFVKVWMHGEFLVLPGKRMGKSEGNAMLLGELGVDPLAYRYLCLLTHYRKSLSYTAESLQAAATAIMNVWTRVAQESEPSNAEPAEAYLASFTAAVNDDLNIPQAIGIMHNLLADKAVPSAEKMATIAQFDRVLGLDLTPDKARLHMQNLGDEFATPTPELAALLEQRMAARAKKDFATADKIRAKIEAQGFVIVDGPEGPRLRKK